MTTTPSPPSADLATQLAQLTDLFRRRLLEDRTMRQAFETQQARIDQLESEVAGDRMLPLLRSLRLVIDRARGHRDDAGFGDSIADEVVEALAAFGFDVIQGEGPFDPSLHEPLASVIPTDRVRVLSVGFRRAGRTLIPARVGVESSPSD